MKVKASPVQGLRGVVHIGITVPNMEEATYFFETVLGAEKLFDVGPFMANDDWMEENWGVHPRAVIRKLRLLRLANGPCLELFEYTSPDQKNEIPKNSDIGGHHITFYVDDIEQTVEQLKSHDVVIQGKIKTYIDGPKEGLSWICAKAPWGLQLKFVSYPKGMVGLRDCKPPIWKPEKVR